MILAGPDVNEPLEAVHRTQDAVHPTKARRRHGGVMRMTAEPHFALLRHRHDPLQEVSDPLPHRFFTHRPALRRRSILFSLVVDEGAVTGPATPTRAFGPHHAEDCEVVLDGGNAGFGHVADHLANLLDFAIALGTLAQHDVWILCPADVRGTERQGHHVQLDPEPLNPLTQPVQPFYRPALVKGSRGEG